MPRLYIIVGSANTRKSSLLRCLTGVCGGRNANQLIDVELNSGQLINIHCRTSALQESLDPKDPVEFVKEINQMPLVPSDIALTLRVNATRRYPTAMNYLAHFANVGWPVVGLALLGQAACALTLAGVPTARVPNSEICPTNSTAASVRRVWGWR